MGRSRDQPAGSKGPFRALVLANGGSVFGDYLNMIAMNLFAVAVTGSAFVTGMMLAVRLASSLATAKTAGRWATVKSRRSILVTCDVIQAVAMLGLAASVHHNEVARPMLFVVAIVVGASSTLSNVALRSSVPEMVGADARVGANAMLSSARSLAMAFGFAAGAAVVGAGGFRTAFIVNASTFVVSAAVLGWLPLAFRASSASDDESETPTRTPEDGHASLGSWRAAIAPVVIGLVFIRAADAFGSASHNVALPVFFQTHHPSQSGTFYGGFWTAWAIGSLIANRALGWLAVHRGYEPGSRAFAGGTIMMSSMFILAFAGWQLGPLLAIAVFAGVADGFTELAYTSRLQAVPDDERGPSFALSGFAESAGFGGGTVIAAVLIGWLGTVAVVGILHGLAIVLAVAFLFEMRGLGLRALRVARPTVEER